MFPPLLVVLLPIILSAAAASSSSLAHTSPSQQRALAPQRPPTVPQTPTDISTPASAQHAPNPLVKTVNTVSLSLLFMLLLWRNLSLYELADQFSSRRMRILTIPPMIIVLAADIIGFLASVFRPHSLKNQLKAILALNSVREGVELAYNAAKLLRGSRYAAVPADIYVGRFFMNVWWLSITFSFSKSRWVSGYVVDAARGRVRGDEVGGEQAGVSRRGYEQQRGGGDARRSRASGRR